MICSIGAGARAFQTPSTTSLCATSPAASRRWASSPTTRAARRWQGETLDFVWFDEEPPLDIYMEGLTRTNATGGLTMITFTPLLGMSDVVSMFLEATA